MRNRTNGTIRQVQDTIVGSSWYGCSADGWNVSLRGIVSDYVLDQIEGNANTSTTVVNIPISPQDWLSWPGVDEDTNEETFNVYIESLNSYININDPEERFLLWDQSNE